MAARTTRPELLPSGDFALRANREGYSLIHPSKIVFRILTGQSVISYVGPGQ